MYEYYNNPVNARFIYCFFIAVWIFLRELAVILPTIL